MAKPTAKRPNLDSERSDSFLRMLALEKQYRMQRIHDQVSATSANGGSMNSFSSGAPVVPLRVRRSSSNAAGPVGSSQVPVHTSKHYKDVPLPELCISIPPAPKRPVAMATRDDIIRDAEIVEPPPQLLPRNHQRDPAAEKDDHLKGVTFADFDDDGNLSDQTSICYSPTWDTRKKKAKSPKLETLTSDKNASEPTSPKKKGKRLSKPPPTPGANVRSITKAERNSSAPRFDLEELDSEAGQQKSSRTRPPDAMKHPELHQKGHTSDSNEKVKNKSFFSRIRRLSFDENMRSPKSPTETAIPPPVQKTHSSGPGTGIGFFSSRKTQNKEASKATDRRSQSALDSRPPVSISTRPNSENKSRSNSLLASTLEKLRGSSKPQEKDKEVVASQEIDDNKDSEPVLDSKSRPSSNGRTTRFIESDDVLPIDTQPPTANFSKKPRSFSGSSQESIESRPTSKSMDKALAPSTKESQGPYKSPYSEDHVSSTDLSLMRPLKPSTSNFGLLSPGLTHLKNARSSEFETASIQESIFNVVNINDRSSDYFDFITDTYTPPSLELGSSFNSPTPPGRSTPSLRPESKGSKVEVDKPQVENMRKSREFPLVNDNSTKSPSTELRAKQELTSTTPANQASSRKRTDPSWSAGSETPTPGSANLATPSLANPKNHSRTGSERSSSSLYDDSAPTPSTPATPDSMRPIQGKEKLPTVRVSSSGSSAKEEFGKRTASNERQSRITLRQASPEASRPKSDRSASIEPRTSEESWKKAPSTLDLDPPPARVFGRADGNGSSSSLASSPTSVKSAKAEMTSAINQQRMRDREMPPRAQSAMDLSSTSFLPPLKHQPLVAKKNKRSSTAPILASPPSDSADDERSGSRPKATRSSSTNGQELVSLSSSGAAYLEEARKSVQPASTGRGFRSPFSQKNSSSTSVKSTASGQGEKPIAKMLVECCGCKFYHDMPSKVYECMAKPDSIVEDRKLGVSAAVTTMVRCPWCGHGMSTQCCAGYAAVIFIKEKLHGK